MDINPAIHIDINTWNSVSTTGVCNAAKSIILLMNVATGLRSPAGAAVAGVTRLVDVSTRKTAMKPNNVLKPYLMITIVYILLHYLIMIKINHLIPSVGKSRCSMTLFKISNSTRI